MTSRILASDQASPPRQSAGHSPLRRARSVRRTSSIDVTWPEGYGGAMDFEAAARDIYTAAAGSPPRVLRTDSLTALVERDRTIGRIAVDPPRPGIEQLVGARGGGYLRQTLDQALPAERDAGSPLYLLIDDFSGTSLVAPWAWSRWPGTGGRHDTPMGEAERQAQRARMEGVCIGFRPGSSALAPKPEADQHCAPVVPLPHPDDPAGWHPLKSYTAIAMRRARRIDVWVDGDIHIDAAFQDSATVPAGGRVAVHEYTLQVTADAHTLRLLSVKAIPRILPHPECPAAVANISRLVGTPLLELRSTVLQTLRRVQGCTHLNDALRALAEVPALLRDLEHESAT